MKRWMENPLLRYQLFGFTVNRWKRQPLLYGVIAGGVGLTYLLVYQLVAFNQIPFAAALNLCLLVMCLVAPLMAYNLFSLEYEKQTWESLALTRLTAREILWGKLGAALARVGILTLLALPILLTTVELDIYIFDSRSGRIPTVLESTTNLYVLTAGMSLLFSWGALIVALGMWLSFYLKRTLSTASTLYAGQVFALALMPMLYLTFSTGETGNEFIGAITSYWEGFVWWIASLFTARVILYLNPFWAANELNAVLPSSYTWRDGGGSYTYSEGLIYLNWGFSQSITYLALALLFAGLTHRGLKHAWRK